MASKDDKGVAASYEYGVVAHSGIVAATSCIVVGACTYQCGITY